MGTGETLLGGRRGGSRISREQLLLASISLVKSGRRSSRESEFAGDVATTFEALSSRARRVKNERRFSAASAPGPYGRGVSRVRPYCTHESHRGWLMAG